jgi:hypothetical protein
MDLVYARLQKKPDRFDGCLLVICARFILANMQTSRTVNSVFGFVAAAITSTGCDPGSDTPTEASGDPGCMAELTMSGTMVPPNGGPPTTGQGCVPFGTWNVSVTTKSLGTCTAVAAKTAYSYVVALMNPMDPRSQTIKYSGALDPKEEVTTNMTSGGNGQCEASFTHLIPATGTSYHQIILKPYFDEGTTVLKGSGAYELWPAKP